MFIEETRKKKDLLNRTGKCKSVIYSSQLLNYVLKLINVVVFHSFNGSATKFLQ